MGVTLGNGKSSEPPTKVRLDIQAEAQKPLDGKEEAVLTQLDTLCDTDEMSAVFEGFDRFFGKEMNTCDDIFLDKSELSPERQ